MAIKIMHANSAIALRNVRAVINRCPMRRLLLCQRDFVSILRLGRRPQSAPHQKRQSRGTGSLVKLCGGRKSLNKRGPQPWRTNCARRHRYDSPERSSLLTIRPLASCGASILAPASTCCRSVYCPSTMLRWRRSTLTSCATCWGRAASIRIKNHKSPKS